MASKSFQNLYNLPAENIERLAETMYILLPLNCSASNDAFVKEVNRVGLEI